jgi:hypothetical protein
MPHMLGEHNERFKTKNIGKVKKTFSAISYTVDNTKKDVSLFYLIKTRYLSVFKILETEKFQVNIKE